MEDLDRIDRALLQALQQDGRMPVSRLAEQVNLSETPCARRLKRLESEGYIERYRACCPSARWAWRDGLCPGAFQQP